MPTSRTEVLVFLSDVFKVKVHELDDDLRISTHDVKKLVDLSELKFRRKVVVKNDTDFRVRDIVQQLTR